MAHAPALEARSGALDISLFPGFAYSDKPASPPGRARPDAR